MQEIRQRNRFRILRIPHRRGQLRRSGRLGHKADPRLAIEVGGRRHLAKIRTAPDNVHPRHRPATDGRNNGDLLGHSLAPVQRLANPRTLGDFHHLGAFAHRHCIDW
ncbi:hypothetical protein D3C81_984730 [compost metagenome]